MFGGGKASSDTQSILGDGSLGVGTFFFFLRLADQFSFPRRELDLVTNFSRVQTPMGSQGTVNVQKCL